MADTGSLPVFIISLDRAEQRRDYMRALIARLGMTAHFVSAVDGQNLTAEQRARYSSRRARRVYGCEMTDNEIACYLSHLSVYSRMLEEGIETALILEDDISCVADFKAILDQALTLPTASWQVLRLQSTKRSVASPDASATRARGEAVAEVGPRRIFRIRTSVLGGCAYLIRRSAASAMLVRSKHIEMPIDQTLDRYWENGIIPYVLRPMPVWHDDLFNSEIGVRGRKLTKKAPAGVLLLRRAQRLLDALNKRVFWLSFRVPSLGQALALAGVASARMALAALWDPSWPGDPAVGETFFEET